MPQSEHPRQRAWRLAKTAAKRMANNPNGRTRNTLFKHIREGLK